MSILFEPVKLKDMVLRNRFIRSATYDGCAEKSGHVSEKQINMYSRLADGGVGLIVTGLTNVHDSGQCFLIQNSLATDEYIEGFRRLTDCVHERGAKIAIQLFHGGREAAGFMKQENKFAVAPSFIENDPFYKRKNYRPIMEEEIRNLVEAFGDAARRAKDAQFDAVQLHGAHGYLFSQFLSPFTNRRTDDWGGTLENRLRFHREVYSNIRKKVGEDYPVLIKFGAQDAVPAGLAIGEGKSAARLLAEWGFDALEISLGLRAERYEGTEFRTKINDVSQEAYFRYVCTQVKQEVKAPIILVGGLRTFELMEEIVQKGEADFISLCRPLICEPALISNWEKGSRNRSKCISCNHCLESMWHGETLHCIQEGAS